MFVKITSSPESDPGSLTSVGWGFDPGQGWCRVAGGITAEDYVAAQWRDDSGGCRLDWGPHTTGQFGLGQQHPWLTQRPAAYQQLVHKNYRTPKGHGQGPHHGDLAVTQPGVVMETWVFSTIRLVDIILMVDLCHKLGGKILWSYFLNVCDSMLSVGSQDTFPDTLSACRNVILILL